MRVICTTHQPVAVRVHPDVKPVGHNRLDNFAGDIWCHKALGHHRQVGTDKNTAVERCKRLGEGEWLDKHLHAQWRPTTRDAEGDTCVPKTPDSVNRTRREHLVLSNQSAIYVGDHKTNIVYHVEILKSPALLRNMHLHENSHYRRGFLFANTSS